MINIPKMYKLDKGTMLIFGSEKCGHYFLRRVYRASYVYEVLRYDWFCYVQMSSYSFWASLISILRFSSFSIVWNLILYPGRGDKLVVPDLTNRDREYCWWFILWPTEEFVIVNIYAAHIFSESYQNGNVNKSNYLNAINTVFVDDLYIFAATIKS